jgi:hypothetical protein
MASIIVLGVWLVFGIGVVASSVTVSVQKHPHAYTEQIATNSTFTNHPVSWTQGNQASS